MLESRHTRCTFCTALLVLLIVTCSANAHADEISVSIGGQTIRLPIPAGFVQVDQQLPAEDIASSRPTGTRILAILGGQKEFASAGIGKIPASGMIMFVEALEKFSDSALSHAEFATLKQNLRQESWLAGRRVVEATDDSILFMAERSVASGRHDSALTLVMLLRSRVVVLSFYRWGDAPASSAAVLDLMTAWRSQCRDSNRGDVIFGPLPRPLSSPWPVITKMPRAGDQADAQGLPPTSISPWRPVITKMPHAGDQADAQRLPPRSIRSWHRYVILWLSSKLGFNLMPLMIGICVVACFVIGYSFIQRVLKQTTHNDDGAAATTDSEKDSKRSGGDLALRYSIDRFSELIEDADE